MGYKTYFKNKKITMLGLGVLGRGLAIAKFLSECGAHLIITDLKPKEALESSLRELQGYKNITYVLGEHRLEDFSAQGGQAPDLIIKAAGVKLDSPFILEAKKNSIPVEMDASLFFKLAKGITTVGVTGTRGKSITTHFIFEILKADGRNVFLGGNVRGTATLPLLKEVKKGDILVLELDSWQLQGFGDAHISPHIAVFTNFMRDHMNYYNGNMDQYFKDKSNIYAFQNKDDLVVAGESIAGNIESRSRKIIARSDSIPSHWRVAVLGEHNRQNIALAILVARELKVSDAVIQKAVEEFKGLSGRLEVVLEKNGVLFINDTTATTPEAAIAGIKSFPGARIHLITGGTDKNLSYELYASFLVKNIQHPILFKGTATEKIVSHFPKEYPYTIVETMQTAVSSAMVGVSMGSVVLLSPGAASFGIFKNEYDRGDQFISCVKAL